ncbi:MAG TPA: hypothetical protein VG939_01790 [Caulobacteraceae bacterium]|nr:hypothetical protein [Caulobacteraceae bacterium]
MSRRNRLLRSIEQRWIARFGEPPTIRTDPALMLRILDDDERRPRPLEAAAEAVRPM